MRNSSIAGRSPRLFVCAFAGAPALVALPCQGQQTISWATAASGQWEVAGNWSPANVPDTSNERAVLGLVGPYEVSLTSGVFRSTYGIEIANPLVTINVPDHATVGTGLSAGPGGLINHGRIRLMGGPASGNSVLSFSSASTISGTGEIVLEDRDDAFMTASSGAVIHAAGHTIRGTGFTEGQLTNQGLIVADVPGAELEVTCTNAGVLKAVNGAYLWPYSVVQTPGGVIIADGGTVRFHDSGGTIEGGTIQTLGGSAFEVLQTTKAEWDGVRLAGTCRILPGTKSAFLDIGPAGLVNDGVVELYAPGSINASLYPADGAVFSGSGRIWMRSGPTSRIIVASGDTVTNEAGHTITGGGNISAPASAELINRGLICSLDAMPSLKVYGRVVQQAGGVIRSQGDGEVQFYYANLVGGVVEATGSRPLLFYEGGLNSLDGCTLRGVTHVQSGDTQVWIMSGGLVNEGIIRLTAEIGQQAILGFAASSTLSGPGLVEMTAEGVSQIMVDTGVTAVHAAGHQILGRGEILGQGTLVNRGEIVAVGGVMDIYKVQNEAILSSSSGSVLQVRTLTQPTGAVCTTEGGIVRLTANANIKGGVLECVNGGWIEVTRHVNATLDGVEVRGRVDVLGPTSNTLDTTLEIGAGSVLNNAVIRVLGDSGTAKARVHFTHSQDLTGGGSIDLVDPSTAYLSVADGATVTMLPPHTITGAGVITGNSTGLLVNRSLIRADGTGQTIDLVRVRNESVIDTAGAGTVKVTFVDQSPAGVLRTDAGTILFRGGTLTGGAIQTLGTGTVQIPGGQTATVSGVEFTGEWRITGPTSGTVPTVLNVQGDGLVNNGLIRATKGTNSSQDTRILITSSQLTGQGEVRLEEALDAQIVAPSASVGTIGPGQVVTGIGQLYAIGTGSLVNHGTIAPGLPLGSIQLNNVTLGPSSRVELELGGASTSQRDSIVNAGAITIGGQLRIRFRDGYQLSPCDEVTAVSGGIISGQFESIDGPLMPVGRLTVRYLPDQVIVVYAPADYDGSGFVDRDDFDSFVQGFEAADPAADVDHSGSVDTDDFTAFIAAFEAGC